MKQIELFEPSPREVGPLALQHVKHAQAARRSAEVAAARGWPALERGYRDLAGDHEAQAEELAALADFYRLGGVVS